VFQAAALPFLDHCDAAKVASRAAVTYPYDKVDLPLIISTGMDSPPLKYGDRENLWFMACIAKYPTHVMDALDVMKDYMSKTRQVGLGRFGFSDHSGVPLTGLYGIAHNLSMLEVHFSSEKTGRDAVVELTVDELKLLCDFRDAVAL
jgi:sialic acid synthase SpsE